MMLLKDSKKSLLIITLLVIGISSDAFAEAAGNPGWWNGTDTPAFAGGVIRNVYCDVISYMGGTLGAMLMAAAGVLAMGTAAFGNFKHGATAAAVGFAAFSMSTIVSLFFGQLCGGGGGAATGKTLDNAQARIEQVIDAPDIDFDQDAEADNNKKDPFDL